LGTMDSCNAWAQWTVVMLGHNGQLPGGHTSNETPY
jgi:hypothetical protein